VTEDHVRQYQKGDESRILALFNATFNGGRSLDRWKWQFERNPQGSPWIALAESGGELLGQYCMIHNHLSLGGREICAAQACDVIVRPDQRGKRWFIRLAESCYSQASVEGLKVVFGFPNRESFPGHVRSLGWERITPLKEYLYRTSIKQLAGPFVDFFYSAVVGTLMRMRAIAFRRSVDGGRIVTSSAIPGSVASLLEDVRNHEIFSVWKDLAYIKWRYEQHPEHRYVYHVLYVGEVAEGLIVSRDTGTSIAICELLHRNKDVAQTVYLLSGAVRYHAKSAAERIEFFGHDDGFFDAVFARCGFSTRYSSGFIFSGRVFGDERLAKQFAAPQNWSVVYGDTDVI
jgi:hypothetical protein